MRLQGPNWDGRRVYQIRNAKLHEHNDGRLVHVTSGEVFLEAQPIEIHAAVLVCTEHWTISNAAVEHPDEEGGPTSYGFDVGDCVKDCPTVWFYDVTDREPLAGEMPKI